MSLNSREQKRVASNAVGFPLNQEVCVDGVFFMVSDVTVCFSGSDGLCCVFVFQGEDGFSGAKGEMGGKGDDVIPNHLLYSTLCS